MKKFVAMLLIFVLGLGTAMADSTALSGTVVATQTETVVAHAGGTVEAVYVSVGDHVQAGDRLATIATTKVYAKEDGTAYVFGESGDAADTVAARYGAVAYIEPAYAFTISASTRYAYDAEENLHIHPGEKVYLRSSQKVTGEGVVTIVNGSSYTVEVLSGDFETGDQVFIFRDESYTAATRIGRGNTSQASISAYEGSGCIVSYAVTNGQQVKKGDLLFETIEGDLAPGTPASCDILATSDGVVSSMNLSVGESISASAAAAVISPDSSLRVEVEVTESDLTHMTIGDQVKVEYIYVSNGELTSLGTIEKISLLGEAASDESEESSYTATILLDDTQNIRYGMNALVTAVQAEATAE